MSRLRVLIHQPACPPYRDSFFSLLAERVALTVLAGDRTTDTGALTSIGQPRSWLQIRRTLRLPFRVHLLRDARLNLASFDRVVVGCNPRHPASIRLYVAARRAGIPVVSWGHIWSPTSTRRTLALRRAFMNRTDGVVVYTQREQRVARSIGVRPPTLAIGNSCFDEATLMQRRALVGDGARGNRFIMLGRLTDKSGWDQLLDVASQVGASAHFTIVGASDAQRRADRPSNVDLVEPVNDELRKRALLARADYFIYPGSIGLAVLEALSLGLPVITHADRRHHGPEHAYLRNGFNALLVRDASAGFVGAVHAVLAGDVALASPFAIADAVAHLTVEAMTERLANFLASVSTTEGR